MEPQTDQPRRPYVWAIEFVPEGTPYRDEPSEMIPPGWRLTARYLDAHDEEEGPAVEIPMPDQAAAERALDQIRELPRSLSTHIGYMVVEPRWDPATGALRTDLPPTADWDGEVHPTLAAAHAELEAARRHGDGTGTMDPNWRLVSVHEVAPDEVRQAIKNRTYDPHREPVNAGAQR